MASTRLLPRATLLALALALVPAGAALGEVCQDCDDGGSGGSGTTYRTPDTTITAGTFGDVNVKRPTETFKSDLATVTYRCRFAPTGESTWSETGAFDCGSTGTAGTTTTWTASSDVPDGRYTFQVRACKAYPGTKLCDQSPALRGVWIDTVAPTVTVTGPADGSRYSGLPAFAFDSPDGAYFHCATAAAAPLADCGVSFTYPAGTPDGPQELRVKSIDGSGNESPVTTIRWTKDTAAPQVVFGGAGGVVGTRRPTITWTGQDADTEFQETCWLEGPGDLWEIWNCPGGSWTPDADLADGKYVLQVRLIDRAGNSSQLEARDFTVDVPAPTGEQPPSDPEAPAQDEAPVEPAAPRDDAPAGAPAPSPAPPTTGGAPVTPAATPKPAAKRKHCRTVTRKVRGKRRKVRVCTKAKKKPRAAAGKRRA